MTKPRSNTSRFVNAAWSLLTFQLIASVGAVGVTGFAAFYVADLAQSQRTAVAPEPAVAEPDPLSPEGQEGAEQTPMPTPGAAPDGQAVTAPPVQVSQCLRTQNPIRVDARAGWCDSGLVMEAGRRYIVRVGEGRWSNAGAPSYGPQGAGSWDGVILPGAALGALIGRVGEANFAIGAGPGFTSPASGPLYLSINDVPGTFDDNQGWVEVYIYNEYVVQ
jgi:hypothetical protein